MNEYEGVFPAVVTPMDNNGNFNEEAFRKVIEFNINAGVGGFGLPVVTEKAFCYPTKKI